MFSLILPESWRQLIGRPALLALTVTVAATAWADPVSQTGPLMEVPVRRLPNGLRYGVIGNEKNRLSPVLLLADPVESVREHPTAGEIGRLLLPSGFLTVIVDTPAHGEDRRPGEGPSSEDGLHSWRRRLDGGDDIFSHFNHNAGLILDYLIKEGEADPKRIAAFGISRGAYVAFHLAAVDSRIRIVGALSPLVDVLAVREFRDLHRRDLAASGALIRIAPQLVGKPIWIGISNNDRRVDVERVIAFSRAVVDASIGNRQDNPVVPVELLVGPASHAGSSGHYPVDGGFSSAANWILQQFGMPEIVRPDADSK